MGFKRQDELGMLTSEDNVTATQYADVFDITLSHSIDNFSCNFLILTYCTFKYTAFQ